MPSFSFPVSSPTTGSADPTLVRSTVADILGLQSSAEEHKANAAAQDFNAQGYLAEVGAYGTSEQIANRNASLEEVVGGIKQLQAARDVYQTVGAQRAQIAGAGFKESGTAVEQLRNSMQQGYLQDQLIRTQTSLTEGGFLEEAAAYRGLSAASTAAAGSATATADAQRTAAGLSTVTATNETAALNKYLKTYGTTDETALATSVLSGGNPADALTKLTTVNPASIDSPVSQFYRRVGRTVPSARSGG